MYHSEIRLSYIHVGSMLPSERSRSTTKKKEEKKKKKKKMNHPGVTLA